MAGHRVNWNLDAFYKNQIGDGFVFCAYSFPPEDFKKSKINGYDMKDVLDISFFDLQYFGKKASSNIGKGNLSNYSFHPASLGDDSSITSVYIITSIISGIKYQIDLGLKNIIIPNYYEDDNLDKFISIIKEVNRWLKNNKVDGLKYFMTVPISYLTIIDSTKTEKLLFNLTGMDIVFDGYYIVCESKPEARTKLNVDFKYLRNLSKVFEVLSKQKFLTIYAYANWDAIIFLATANIDYVTIATYENLRNFTIKRFIQTEDGGPSKGWYFSEKLLNMVKAQLLDLIRIQNGIDIIANERNIFSDFILTPEYDWSNQKPDVHKNYLLAINRLLKEISEIQDIEERKQFVLDKIQNAIDAYRNLESKRLSLPDESKNYHLQNWQLHLRTK